MSVTTQEKVTPRYEHFVEDQLTRAQRRIRWLDTGTAILILGIATLGYALGTALLDRWFELSAYTRQAAFAIYALVTGIYLAWAVIRPLWHNVNPYYAAQQVERTLPDAKNSLVNWLDLKNRQLPGAIRGAVTHRAAKDFAHADIEEAFDAHRAVWLSAFLLALAFGLVILFLQGPPQFFSLLDRAFVPFRSSPLATRTQLHVLKPAGGDATVQVGRAVGFQLRVDGRIPDRSASDAIKFLFRYQPNVPYEERAVDQGETTGEFILTLPAYDVHNGFWYKFQGGDAETREFQVRVRSAPLVTDFDVTYHFRPYLRRADQTSRDPNLEAVEGTEVSLIAHTNRMVRSGGLEVGEEQSIPGQLVTSDPRALRFPLTIKSDETYKIAFVSREGEKSEDSGSFTIHAIPDRAPVAEISEPGNATLPANGILRVRGSARDDFGLQRVSLHMLKCEPDVVPYHQGKSLRMEDGSYPRQLDYKDFVDLSKVQHMGRPLQAGEVIEYWLEALDNCDFRENAGQSKHYRITIGEPQDPAQHARQRQQAQADQDRHEQEQQQQVGGKPEDERQDGDKSAQGSKGTSDQQEGKDGSKDQDLQNRADQLSRAIDEQERKENNQQPDKSGKDQQQQAQQTGNGSGGDSQANQKQSAQGNGGGSGSKQDQPRQGKQGGNGSGEHGQANQKRSDQGKEGGGKPDQQKQDQLTGNGSGGDNQANQKQSDQRKEGGSSGKGDKTQNQGDRGNENAGNGSSNDGNQNNKSQSKGTNGSTSKEEGKAGGNSAGDGAKDKSWSKTGGQDGSDKGDQLDQRNGGAGSKDGKKSPDQSTAKGASGAEGQHSGNEKKARAGDGSAQASGNRQSGQNAQEQSSGNKSEGAGAASGEKQAKSAEQDAGKSNGEQARDSSSQENGSKGGRQGPSAPGNKAGDQGERSTSDRSSGGDQERQNSGSKQTSKDGETPDAKARDKGRGAGEERAATDTDVPDLLERLKHGDASVRRESRDKLNQMKDGIKDPNLRQKVDRAVKESGSLEKMPHSKEQSAGMPADQQQKPKDGGRQTTQQSTDGSQQTQPSAGSGLPSHPSDAQESRGGDSSQVAGRRRGEPTTGADQGAASAADQRFQRMPGQLQLDYIKNHMTPDVLKKLNMTPDEYRQFLKDYAERATRQVSRPGNEEKLTDPRANGNTVQNRGSRQVKPGAVKDDRSSHAGQLEAPPEYRESYRDFTQKLAGEKSTEPSADREKK